MVAVVVEVGEEEKERVTSLPSSTTSRPMIRVERCSISVRRSDSMRSNPNAVIALRVLDVVDDKDVDDDDGVDEGGDDVHVDDDDVPLADKIFEKVINPYLTEVLKHPQSIKMSKEMLHIRDVEGPKKTESMETRLEAMDQQVFKCQGMVERGLNTNHTMIMEFTSNHKIDATDIGKHLSRLYDRVDQLQGQIYDLQNQNCEYKYRLNQ
ncbi:40S ribosomal protein S5-1 [Hordeum vulgare]|nr:40S ribosomal protein S5-1 [Hordeum vulgare]